MWGRFVDSGLAEVVREAKDDKSATRKGMAFMQRVMSDPEELREEGAKPTTGKFRDPADKFKK